MTISAIQGWVGPVWDKLPPHTVPGLSAVGVIGALVAVGALKYQEYNSLDYKAKTVLDKLLVKEWFLPQKGETLATDKTVRAKPIYNQKTRQEFAGITEMILKSKDSKGVFPLPNLVIKGKAGVGKTMGLEYLCRQTGVGFIRLPSGAMENHLKAATHIQALHDAFELAEKSQTPIYIIMDDGEQLVAQRPLEVKVVDEKDPTKAHWLVKQKEVADTIAGRRIALVNAILEESGKDKRKVGFAITTNRADVIDSAFLSRAQVIEIIPPTEQERKNIIITHLPVIFNEDYHLINFFDAGRLEDTARKTEGFTGRNIVRTLESIYATLWIGLSETEKQEVKEGKRKLDISQEILDASIIEQSKSVVKVEPVRVPVQPEAIKPKTQPIATAEKVQSLWKQISSVFVCC